MKVSVKIMWEIIGYETKLNDEGKIESVNLYCTKAFRDGQGEGKRCRRVWYRASDILYRPAVGDQVFIETEVRGKFEFVVDIFK